MVTKNMIRKRELAIFAVILLFAFGGLAWMHFRDSAPEGGNGSYRLYAEIHFQGVPVRRVFLDYDMSFAIEGVRFEVRGGGLAFVESDCPDQVCIHMGFQSRVGGFAACLPNGLFFNVERMGSRFDEDVDFIVR